MYKTDSYEDSRVIGEGLSRTTPIRTQNLRRSTRLQRKEEQRGGRFLQTPTHRVVGIEDLETPPTTSILDNLYYLERTTEEKKDSDPEEEELLNTFAPFSDTLIGRNIEKNLDNTTTETMNTMQEKEDFKAIPMYNGRSALLGKEVLSSIENMRKTYQWSDETVIRKLSTKLKGTKLKEWLLTVKQLPDEPNKWDAIKLAFERRFINMSHAKRWGRIKKLKQKKYESLEVYRGRLEELVAPAEMNEKEKINLFILGLRKQYRRRLNSFSKSTSISELIEKLTEDEEYLSSSDEDESEGDESDSSSDDSSDSSSDDSDDDKRRKKKKTSKKTLKNKRKNLKKKKEDRLSKQLQEVQKKLNALTHKSNVVFSVNKQMKNEEVNNSLGSYQDMRTTTGVDVCGRCQRAGHKSGECPRKTLQCRRCYRNGHVTPECRVNLGNSRSLPINNGNFRSNLMNNMMNNNMMNNNMMNNNMMSNNMLNNNVRNNTMNHGGQRPVVNNRSNRPPPTCYRCGQPGHLSTQCNVNMVNNVNRKKERKVEVHSNGNLNE